MKNLKFIFAAILFVTFSNTIHAQISEGQKEEMIAQYQQNKERLQLTPEQEAPFKEISKKFMQQMKAVKDSDESRRDKFQKLKGIMEAKNAEMKTLLSDSQYKTYLQIQDERKEKLRERRNNN